MVAVAGSKSVVIAGLPGSGKTSVARSMGEILGVSVLDIDAEIERLTSSSIADLIRVEGEQRFRELESETLLQALKSKVEIISLGGGALLREENRRAVRSLGCCIYLRVREETAARRTVSDQWRAGSSRVVRPVLFKGIQDTTDERTLLSQVTSELTRLVGLREQFYREVAHLSISTDDASPEVIAREIIREVRMQMDQAGQSTAIIPMPTLQPDGFESRVVIEAGLIERAGKRISEIVGSGKAVIIADEAVLNPHCSQLSDALNSENIESLIIAVPSGESSKSFAALQELTNELTDNQIGKSDTIIAVGGGVVGDIGGFLASIYMRGLKLIQVPTTVVAQVDSAIGGKTAINTEAAKNLVGTFYPAKAILVDPRTLKTLPEREYLSGLAEVIKYGAIGDNKFLNWLDESSTAIVQRDEKTLLKLLEFCAQAKVSVVSQDLEDKTGVRATLNFGHTFGHALEQITEYKKYLHGEAISWGMVVALKISSLVTKQRIENTDTFALLLQRFGLPTEVGSDLTKGAKEYLLLHGVEREEELFNAEEKGGLGERTKAPVEEETLRQASEFELRWKQALVMDKKREHGAMNFVIVNPLGCASVKKLQLDTLLRCFAWSLVTGYGA